MRDQRSIENKKACYLFLAVFLVMFYANWSEGLLGQTSETLTYVYDNLNRLIQVKYASGFTINYTYDSAGNRLILSQVGAPDLSVSKNHSGNFTVGINRNYSILVQNVGTGPTTGVITVTDALPTGLSFVTATGSGWYCYPSGQTAICTNSNSLDAGSSSTITLTVEVGAAAVGTATNSVTVTTSGDLNSANNSASDPTTVVGVPDLTLTKSHSGNFTVGSNGTYTLTVRNVGSGGSSGAITITDTVPNGLSFISGSGSGWTFSSSGQTVTCTNPGVLAAGASSSFTLTVGVSTAAFPIVANSATVSNSSDANSSNNTASDTTSVASSTFVANNNGPICAGQTLSLTASTVSGASYSWTGPNGFTSTQQNPMIPSTTTTASGTYTVTATLSGSTYGMATTTAVVNPTPATPAITAPSSALPGQTGLTASVTSHTGAGYTWSITNGTFTSGNGTSQITFTAGSTGSVTLQVIETNSSGCASAQTTANVPISGSPAGTNFYTVTPCRVLDTRNPNGALGGPALAANTDRTFVIAGQCGIPATAKAVSVNITVTQATGNGDLRLYPGGTMLPLVSAINYRVGQTRANNAIVFLGSNGDITVHCDQVSGTVHFIIDVNGYFQ